MSLSVTSVGVCREKGCSQHYLLLKVVGSKFESELELPSGSSCNEHWQKCDLQVQEKRLRGFLSYQVALTKDSVESSVKESEPKDSISLEISW